MFCQEKRVELSSLGNHKTQMSNLWLEGYRSKLNGSPENQTSTDLGTLKFSPKTRSQTGKSLLHHSIINSQKKRIRSFDFQKKKITPEKTPTLGNTKELFFKHFTEYLDEIERATKIKIPQKQKDLLLDHAKRNYIGPLSKPEKDKARKEYNRDKSKIIESWENNTGKKWPYTKGDGERYNGKLISNSPVKYQIHHIILISYAGPNEWWNMWPAKFPNEHQGGIHRKGGPASKLFPDD